MKQWCDVQDQDGFWKIGYIIDRQSTSHQQNIYKIRLDGYHPGYDTFYCDHSSKLHPVRTHTMGFNTYPKAQSQSIILRQPLNLDQLKLNHNRLSLISKMQNLLQNTQESIKIFMRTQLLILIDKIMKTPFPLITFLKMADLWVNKLFLVIITFYIKLLDSSKKFIPLIDGQNKIAKQLLLSMYQFSIMTKLIIGSHQHSKSFYQNPTNLTIKNDGFIEFFIRSDNGILPFKIFFKNLTIISLKNIDKKLIDAIFQVLDFFLDLCQKSKGQLFQTKYAPQTKSVIDQIINFLKVFAVFNPENQKYIKQRVQTINRLQTLQLKVKPKKTSQLRNQIFGQEKQTKPKQKEIKQQVQQVIEPKPKATSQQIDQLTLRVKRLEDLLSNYTPATYENIEENKTQSTVIKSVKNLGEQQFLASLSWALNCGDLEACKKLVTWRQNLLRLGKIAGWQIALQVGMKTMSKAEISHQDIITANVQMIKNANQQNKNNKQTIAHHNLHQKQTGNTVNKPEKE